MIKVESLEIHVSNHCNLSCKGCSHISPLEKKKFIDQEEMIETLKILRKVLHCDTIRLLGGEPTLNPNLEAIVNEISKLHIADHISIATNGVFLDRINDSILRKIDIVEISNYNYSDNITSKMVEWATRAKNKYNVKTYIYMYKYFREPISYIRNDNEIMVNNIYKTCIVSQKWQCFNVYERYFFKCPQAMAISKNIDNCDFEKNGIKIVDDKNLENTLLSYIDSLIPLQACKYCLGTVGKRFEIRQSSKEEYIKETTKTCDELLDKEFLEECLTHDVGNMMTVEKVLEF